MTKPKSNYNLLWSILLGYIAINWLAYGTKLHEPTVVVFGVVTTIACAYFWQKYWKKEIVIKRDKRPWE